MMGVGGACLALLGLRSCFQAPRIRAIASPVQPGKAWTFRSRPDLRPPSVEVTKRARNTAPGYLFAASKNGPGEEYPAQDGPMILDNDGQPVWLCPVRGEEKDAMDFKVQRYRGEPVLTWWEGVHTGYGQGEYQILDNSYREVARVRAGNGYDGDHHEFLITPEDTALFTIYHKMPMDLSSVGGPKEGTVLDGIVQEVDIETGEVLFEWHSLEHVGIEES
jgi:Arylsulfotransferase (ASST)